MLNQSPQCPFGPEISKLRMLHQLGVGCAGCVAAVGGDRELRRRLLEMGFCNGVQVTMIRRAPWGDPIEFSLRGYCISLRSEQARHITVTP